MNIEISKEKDISEWKENFCAIPIGEIFVAKGKYYLKSYFSTENSSIENGFFGIDLFQGTIIKFEPFDVVTKVKSSLSIIRPYSKVIAVDFDGCLVENKYPNIGAPHKEVIQDLISEQRLGAKIILWTCREGKELDEAIKFCGEQGIYFDAVNKNLPERIVLFKGSDPRKIGADEYWDDRAIQKGTPHES